MGKRILVQRKGRGHSRWQSHKRLKIGAVKHPSVDPENPDRLMKATIIDLLHEPGRGTPLALIEMDWGKKQVWLPPEGVFVGDTIEIGSDAALEIGNTLELSAIPEGAYVYNIEKLPRDGGRYVRAGGTFAIVSARGKGFVTLKLPSKKILKVSPKCRATLGIVASGGRTQKPFVKAGNKYHWMKKKTTNWPIVNGVRMNACSHPFGGGRKKTPSKPTTVSRHAPPGRKVGHIAARRTGVRR